MKEENYYCDGSKYDKSLSVSDSVIRFLDLANRPAFNSFPVALLRRGKAYKRLFRGS